MIMPRFKSTIQYLCYPKSRPEKNVKMRLASFYHIASLSFAY